MKVYLAGFENLFSKLIYKDSTCVFGTFYNEKNTTKMIDYLYERQHKGTITIDSGAHSFFNLLGMSVTSSFKDKKTGKEIKDPNEYFYRYLNWVKKHYSKISYFVELDLQPILGLEKILYWRQIMKNEGIFDKCITVHHKCDTMDDYISMLETSKSGYVGLEGLVNKRLNIPYMKLIKEAYLRGVKVHGFALTNKKMTEKYPFYSVDSTTWLNSSKFGSSVILDKFGFIVQKTPKLNEVTKHGGFSISKYNTGSDATLVKLNNSIKVVQQYSKHLESFWIKRGVNWNEQIKKRMDGSLDRSNGDCRLELQE